MKTCVVDAAEDKKAYEHKLDVFKHSKITPQPSFAVRMHGKKVELLGEWEGRSYCYAAIREFNSDKYDYNLIHPKYLKERMTA